MSIEVLTDSHTLFVTAHKSYVFEGSYGWTYEVDFYTDAGVENIAGRVETSGLLEDPTVRLIQALTGMPRKEIRNLLVRAQDARHTSDIEARREAQS